MDERDEDDPYRPPEARIAPIPLATEPEGQTCWRHGTTLVVLRDAPLPIRCVKCNADAADGVRERRFRWVTKWVYAILLVIPVAGMVAPLVARTHHGWLLAAMPSSLLATLIAIIALRRTARHAVGLCERHRRDRRRWLWSAMALLVAALLSPFVVDTLAPTFLLGGLAVVVAWSGGRILTAVRIDARYSFFGDCDEAFLRSLPMLPEYRLHYLKPRAKKP
jgi:hypothetical protein